MDFHLDSLLHLPQVTVIDQGSLLEVIDSHKSDEIIEALKSQPESIRENVKEVSVDMWGGFQKVIKEVLQSCFDCD